MKNSMFIPIIAVLLLSSALLICNPANAQNKNASKSDTDRSKQIEHRIDQLTMIIADKNEEGIDTKNAENLLLEAIDLFEENKIEESVEKLMEVEKALGLKPIGLRENRNPGMMGEFSGNNRNDNNFSNDPRQGPRPYKKVEMSESEKKAALSEIKELIKSAQKLIEEENLEEAFKKLSDAHRMLADVTGIRPPFMDGGQGRMGPGGPGGPGEFGPQDGFGPPPQGGPQGGRNGGQGGPRDNQRGGERGFMGDRPNGQGADIEKIFEKAKERGEEGFDKLSENFENLIDKLKGRGVEYNTDAEELYRKAVSLRDNGELDSAFEKLQEAFELIKDSADNAFPSGGPGMRGGPGQRPMGGNNLDSESSKKLKSAFDALKGMYHKYLDKHERDEFIETCFDDFINIQKKLKRGEIEVDDAVKEINALKKKVEENI
ncbi:hypothetical protein KKB99_08070 [bacterium]|nr:hypothetical protein [bacterium]MBU1025947.1 hypothetical protein [bacterium]